MNHWLKARLGRVRVSTIVLVVAFIALLWVDQNFGPKPQEPTAPAPAVVPPGFVPDPNYTWVPRTNVRRPKEPEFTTTTTTTTTTTPTPTPEPTPTTTPTTPPPSPTDVPGAPPVVTTVIDPDGIGPMPPTTQTITATTPEPPPQLPGLPQLPQLFPPPPATPVPPS
ncbi:hypothetical protein [Mycolicibacterium phlei]|uniref:hypothetical protein n=1 Tax=Mycolicibacterium phlei TaxID=1771 RepID=UPI0037CAFC1C